MLHVDAHYDTYGPVFGSFIHNGSFKTTGIMMDRLMRTFLAGHAARKKGVTDPNYIASASLSHGQAKQ